MAYKSFFEDREERKGQIGIEVHYTAEKTVAVSFNIIGVGMYVKELTIEDAYTLAGRIDVAALKASGHKVSKRIEYKENDLTNVVNFASGSAA